MTDQADRACRNCGAALVGPYCAACGQRAHVHRSLPAIGHDIAHGVLHLDGKVAATIPLLAWRPGELTRRYVMGQRARFVSPIGLFLFTVFLSFAVTSLLGAPLAMGDAGMSRAVAQDIAREEAAAAAAVAAAREAQATATTPAARTAAAKALADAIAEQQTVTRARAVMTEKGAAAGVASAIRTDVPALDDALRRAANNPGLFFYTVKTNAYKFAWAVIPLSALLMWPLFAWRRDVRLYDHAVFVTYSLSFVLMLLILAALMRTVGLHGNLWLALIIPWHFYRQLRGAYALSPASAAWRALVLVVIALVVSVSFLLALIGMGLMG